MDLLTELQKDNQIKKEGGKQGKYKLAQDFFSNPFLDAELFGHDFISKILQPGEYTVLTEKRKELGAKQFSIDRNGKEYYQFMM